jgi:hypothetical protein
MSRLLGSITVARGFAGLEGLVLYPFRYFLMAVNGLTKPSLPSGYFYLAPNT